MHKKIISALLVGALAMPSHGAVSKLRIEKKPGREAEKEFAAAADELYKKKDQDRLVLELQRWLELYPNEPKAQREVLTLLALAHQQKGDTLRSRDYAAAARGLGTPASGDKGSVTRGGPSINMGGGWGVLLGAAVTGLGAMRDARANRQTNELQEYQRQLEVSAMQAKVEQQRQQLELQRQQFAMQQQQLQLQLQALQTQQRNGGYTYPAQPFAAPQGYQAQGFQGGQQPAPGYQTPQVTPGYQPPPATPGYQAPQGTQGYQAPQGAPPPGYAPMPGYVPPPPAGYAPPLSAATQPNGQGYIPPPVDPYALPQGAAAPVTRSGAKTLSFRVVQDHSRLESEAYFEQACGALLSFDGANLVLTSSCNIAPRVIPAREVLQIRMNTVVGAEVGAFSILTRKGLYLHLVTEEGTRDSSENTVDALRAALRLD